jgi:hypothetical protein
MSPRARRILACAAFLGLAAGCAHRPDPQRAAPLSPQAADPAAAKSAPSPAARRSAPGTPFTRADPAAPLSSLLIVTTQVAHEDIFLPGLSGAGPPYHPVARLYRGQRAFIIPIVRNYAFDALERTDLTFEVLVHRLDGSVDGAPCSAVLWQDSVSSPDGSLYPATTVVFQAEPHDPAGPCRVSVRIRDHLSGQTTEVAHNLLITDYTPPDLPADFDPELWFNRYHQQPTPELALPALPRFFQKLPADKRAGALPPLLGFYEQVLTDNPWLLPSFCARLATAPADEAYALSLVLGFHLRAASSAPPGIDSATWDRLADFRNHPWPSDPEQPLLLPAQLDTLWGRFFASALYAPVRRLMDPMAYHADLGAAERWRKALPAPAPGDALPMPDLDDPDTPVDLRREVMLRTALWSLRANARQHPLVRNYLEQTLRAGDLAPYARAFLQHILQAEPASVAVSLPVPPKS